MTTLGTGKKLFAIQKGWKFIYLKSFFINFLSCVPPSDRPEPEIEPKPEQEPNLESNTWAETGTENWPEPKQEQEPKPEPKITKKG